MNAPVSRRSRWLRLAALFLLTAALGALPAMTAQRHRSLCCGLYNYNCGQANQPTCTSGPACDAGYLSWDMPNQSVNCPWPCADETITHGCYDPDNPPSCSLCGGHAEPPCPGGTSCTPGCASGHVLAGGVCYAAGCGGDLELPCPNGACQAGIELQGAICANCGGNQEAECLLGSACRHGAGAIGPDKDGYRVCAYCGGDDGILACEGGVCDTGYQHHETSSLSAPIASCPDMTSSDNQTWYLNQNGICSSAVPDPFSRPAPEGWPAAEEHAPGRGTVVIIHGRGSRCGPSMDNMLDAGGIAPLGHRTYCAEYAQESTPGVDRRLVRLLPAFDDVLGRPPGSCVATGDCRFDHDHPEAEALAPTFDIPGVAGALAQALAEIPTDGPITLIPHSQGGFIARQLLYAHYDDLRWRGKEIGRVISLAHPYFVKHLDPRLYTPWLCAGSDGFDCATGKWAWGWDLNVLGTPGSIDNGDYPQIDWTAVSGDGQPGQTTPEDVDGDGDADARDDACLIFGGVSRLGVAGDSSVPIQSSLGYDEFGFFRRASLDFDRRLHADCTHTAACHFSEAATNLPVCTAGGGAPPPPLDACWGSDPAGTVLPPANEPPRPSDSLRFDGGDQVAVTDTAANAALKATNALTMEAWIRPDLAGQNVTFFAKEGEYQLSLLPSAGKSVLAWAIANASPGWVSTLTTFEPPLNQWTHVALTYNGSVVRIYANGIEIQSQAAAGAIGDFDPSRNELRIGGRQASPTAFSGFLDDARVWKRALSRHEIAAGMNGQPGAGNLTGLAGWWPLDEAGGDALLDAGPHGITLSLSSLGAAAAPVRVAARGARPGGALYFDGTGDFAVVSDPTTLSSLEMTGSLTIEAWIFPRGAGTAGVGGVILNKEGEYALTRWADGRITWSLANAAPGWVSTQSTHVAPVHAWTHVALTYDAGAGEARLYVNGALHQTWAAEGPIGDVSASDELRIGGRQGSVQYFHGVIDEVRLFDIARDAAAIAADYDRVLSDPSAVPGLVAYWRLDEAQGGVVIDSAGSHPMALGNNAAAVSPARALAPQLPGYALLDRAACGNGFFDPLETCDDGGTVGGDGCSAGCRIENAFTLRGAAQGGSVSMVVEGVTITVFTTAGDTLAMIAAALAAAINADPTLQSRGITATAAGNDLLIGGDYGGVIIGDPGLSDCSTGPAAPTILGDAVNACPATTAALSAGPGYAAYQWRYEGWDIPGATGSAYEATLSGSYSVAAWDGFGCPVVSTAEPVTVDFCPGTEVSPAGAIFPLRVTIDAASPTGRYLYFQKVGGADGYHLYIGAAGEYYSHGASPDNQCNLTPCVIPDVTGCYDDLGAGELRMALPAGPADAYYLVSAHAMGVEGPAGKDSLGAPIDPAQSTCLP